GSAVLRDLKMFVGDAQMPESIPELGALVNSRHRAGRTLFLGNRVGLHHLFFLFRFFFLLVGHRRGIRFILRDLGWPIVAREQKYHYAYDDQSHATNRSTDYQPLIVLTLLPFPLP